MLIVWSLRKIQASLVFCERLANIEKSALDTMVVTNSIPTSPAALKSDRIRVLTIGKMLAEAMRRVSNEESISAMFD